MDQRLGFFHTLRAGDGPLNIYAKLVGSPRAIGLRHVDVPNGDTLGALLAARRSDLTQLSNVKFATRTVIDGLADPTFDRVERLHTQTSLRAIDQLLQFFIRDDSGFFARAPRHLILTERVGWDAHLVPFVERALSQLPVLSVTIGTTTLVR